MKRIAAGILAHVDSGKTTLSEALLFRAGDIRKQGRVDNGDAFLDTHELEKQRGITIFSKQAVLHLESAEVTLLDTPGHIDFSPEAERVLSVLDCAVLVISASDGVQSHTETLWKLLEAYNVPTFIFVNKLDIAKTDKNGLMSELKSRLSPACADFSDDGTEAFFEEISMCDNAVMEKFLEEGEVDDETIINAVKSRKIFPCCFGSALKNIGIDEFIRVFGKYTAEPLYGDKFGARVFKIADDGKGNRLTHLKITGGSLKVRDTIEYKSGEPEKVTQIRIYSGEKFSSAEEAPAGTVCAVTGLTKTYAGQGLGAENDAFSPLLEPVLSYRVYLPDGTDAFSALSKLQKLEEEDPQLRISWNERLKEIHISVMGEIQLEILKSVIADRFKMDVSFGSGGIAYKETVKTKTEGVGHYEPLKHYAEVHLIIGPAERGSGVTFASSCREDDLDRNWQRLILSNLAEKTHLGVLTGSPLTDVKITLSAGKAHLKHTEGGDFRQASWRAVRNGLMKAESVLLEPWYDFRLEVPNDCVGRAMTDIQNMSGSFEPPLSAGENTLLTGSAPVSEMRDYHKDVISYTHGKGRISCVLKGYFPCHNADEVIASIGYDPESDLDNSPDSVFCAHGAGFVVKWNEVEKHMHLESTLSPAKKEEAPAAARAQFDAYRARLAEDKELMAIFERTYGKIDRDERYALHTEKHIPKPKPSKPQPLPKEEYLLVDGYNIIFAWDELKKAAEESLDLARSMLINTLCNYQGFRQCNLILVFDAYKVKGEHREVERICGIDVVYTKEAETADSYIEKTAHELVKDYRVRVATSDNLEQIIILGSGAYRVSASEFHEEIKQTERTIRGFLEKQR